MGGVKSRRSYVIEFKRDSGLFSSLQIRVIISQLHHGLRVSATTAVPNQGKSQLKNMVWLN